MVIEDRVQILIRIFERTSQTFLSQLGSSMWSSLSRGKKHPYEYAFLFYPLLHSKGNCNSTLVPFMRLRTKDIECKVNVDFGKQIPSSFGALHFCSNLCHSHHTLTLHFSLVLGVLMEESLLDTLFSSISLLLEMKQKFEMTKYIFGSWNQFASLEASKGQNVIWRCCGSKF